MFDSGDLKSAYEERVPIEEFKKVLTKADKNANKYQFHCRELLTMIFDVHFARINDEEGDYHEDIIDLLLAEVEPLVKTDQKSQEFIRSLIQKYFENRHPKLRFLPRLLDNCNNKFCNDDKLTKALTRLSKGICWEIYYAGSISHLPSH